MEQLDLDSLAGGILLARGLGVEGGGDGFGRSLFFDEVVEELLDALRVLQCVRLPLLGGGVGEGRLLVAGPPVVDHGLDDELLDLLVLRVLLGDG